MADNKKNGGKSRKAEDESDYDQETQDRLLAMQFEALGLHRLDIMMTDFPENYHNVDANVLNGNRNVNTADGVQNEQLEQTNAWNNVWRVLQDDGAAAGTPDARFDGQYHRNLLAARLAAQNQHTRPTNVSGRPGNPGNSAARGNHSRGSGRGGGVIGTRARGGGQQEASPPTFTPPGRQRRRAPSRGEVVENNTNWRDRTGVASTATFSPGTSSRGRAAAAFAAPGATSIRGRVASRTLNVAPDRTQQARNTNVAFNLASPDKFLAGMLAVNRCTRASSTPAEPSVPVSQLSEAIRLAPSGTNAGTAVLFSPEIDEAPAGTRVPTPPPDASELGTSQGSYMVELAGLDFQSAAATDAEDDLGPDALDADVDADISTDIGAAANVSEGGDSHSEAEALLDATNHTDSTTVGVQHSAVDAHAAVTHKIAQQENKLTTLSRMLPALGGTPALNEVMKLIAEASSELEAQHMQLRRIEAQLTPQASHHVTRDRAVSSTVSLSALAAPAANSRLTVGPPTEARADMTPGAGSAAADNPINASTASGQTMSNSTSIGVAATTLSGTNITSRVEDLQRNSAGHVDTDEDLHVALRLPPLAGSLGRSQHTVGPYVRPSDVAQRPHREIRSTNRDDFIIGEHLRPLGRIDGQRSTPPRSAFATGTSPQHEESVTDALPRPTVATAAVVAQTTPIEGLQRPRPRGENMGNAPLPTVQNNNAGQDDSAVEPSIAQPRIQGRVTPYMPDNAITRQYAHRPYGTASSIGNPISAFTPQVTGYGADVGRESAGHAGSQFPLDTTNPQFAGGVPRDSRAGTHNHPASITQHSTRDSGGLGSRQTLPSTSDGEGSGLFMRPTGARVTMRRSPQLPAFLAGNTVPSPTDPGAAARAQYGGGGGGGGGGGRDTLALNPTRQNQAPVRRSVTNTRADTGEDTNSRAKNAKDPWQQARQRGL